MSRHGYSDYIDNHWDLIRWRGQVASAIRGKRGQRLLADLIGSLEAMPPDRRELHADVIDDGCHMCALGAVARKRGVDLSDIDPGEYCADEIAGPLDIADQLAAEIMFENDNRNRTPQERWRWIYGWALRKFRGHLGPISRSPFSVGNVQRLGGDDRCSSGEWSEWHDRNEPGVFDCVPQPSSGVSL